MSISIEDEKCKVVTLFVEDKCFPPKPVFFSKSYYLNMFKMAPQMSASDDVNWL